MFGPSHACCSHPRRRRPQQPFTTLSADAKSANLQRFSLPHLHQERISYGCQVPSCQRQSRPRHSRLYPHHPSGPNVARTIADTAFASLRPASALDSPALAPPHPPQGGCTYSLHGSTTGALLRSAAATPAAPAPLQRCAPGRHTAALADNEAE